MKLNRRGRLKVTSSNENSGNKQKEIKPKTVKVSELDEKARTKVIKKYSKPPSKRPIPKDNKGNKVSAIKVDKRATDSLKKYRFLTFKMYSYKIFNYLLRGSIDRRDPNLNGDNIQVGYSEIFTTRTVTRYYVLSYLPEDLPVGFMNYVTNALKSNKFWVKVDLQIKNKKYNVDLNKQHIEKKLEKWAKTLDEDYQDVSSLDGKEYVRDLAESARRKKHGRLYRSFFKIRSNIGHLKEGTVIIKVQTKEKEDIQLAEKSLNRVLKELKIEHYRVNGTLLDFLRAYSPVSLKTTVTSDTASRVVLTDEDIARMIPYRQGAFNKLGIPLGFDRLSGDIAKLDLNNTSDAKNIFIWSKTGSGKTYLMRKLAMYHYCLKHNIFFVDYKGNEYTDYTKAVGGIIISQTPSRSSFLNLWVIPTEEDNVTESELVGYYTEIYGLAELEFLTLTEPMPHEIKDYKNIFADYWQHCHRSCEVYIDKPETYHRTSLLTPKRRLELYNQFSGPRSTGVIAQYGEHMLRKIYISLYKYWSPKGARNELYRNEISLSELCNSKVVCFDFGMLNTPKESIPINEMNLKYIFMNVSATRYANHNDKNREFTVKVNEEVQEVSPEMLSFISNEVTVGRSKGLINYVIGNATGSLASDSQYAKNIMQSMTVKIIGRLDKDAREFCISNFGLEKVSNYIEKIGYDENYRRNFVVDSNLDSSNFTAVVQSISTDRVNNSVYFKTVKAQSDLTELVN